MKTPDVTAGTAAFTRSADRLHEIFARAHESPNDNEEEAAMVASMIGLGPHDMTGWLWAFSIGLTVALGVFAALSFSLALRSTSRSRRSGR